MHINPDKPRFQKFKDLPKAGPIDMLNLVRFREKAIYEDGREATGREAYAAYSRESGPIFEALGGRIIWSGNFELMLIGPEDEEQWDACFIAQYPSSDAFISMIRDTAYQKAVLHRTAAVEDSRLIRLSPREAGKGFG